MITHFLAKMTRNHFKILCKNDLLHSVFNKKQFRQDCNETSLQHNSLNILWHLPILYLSHQLEFSLYQPLFFLSLSFSLSVSLSLSLFHTLKLSLSLEFSLYLSLFLSSPSYSISLVVSLRPCPHVGRQFFVIRYFDLEINFRLDHFYNFSVSVTFLSHWCGFKNLTMEQMYHVWTGPYIHLLAPSLSLFNSHNIMLSFYSISPSLFLSYSICTLTI